MTHELRFELVTKGGIKKIQFIISTFYERQTSA